jgi:ssDNA-binding Zn-finger/Zn-ribbon topoisomerase 1
MVMADSGNVCPKCGRSSTVTEVDPNTGQIFIVCSNKACRAVKAKGWF